MMQLRDLVLFLFATSAALATTEDSSSYLWTSKDIDSFEIESEVDGEEHKRSLYNWLSSSGKGPIEVEKEIFEVELPVKEEVLMKVPSPVELPLPERPYSVELRLSVPESMASPIKFHVPVHDHRPAAIQVGKVSTPMALEWSSALQDPHAHARKPELYSEISKPHNYFPHSLKTDYSVIESHPVIKEFTEVKSPLEALTVDEHTLLPHRAYSEKIFPSKTYNYFSHPLKTDYSILESHPVVTEVTEIKEPLEAHIVEEDIYVPEIQSFDKMGYSHKNWFSKPKVVVEEIDQITVPYEEEKIVKTHPFYNSQHFKSIVEEPIVSFDSINIPFEKERIFKTHPSTFYHPHSLSTVVEEFDRLTVPYEEEKMIKTHPFYRPEVHSFGKMGYPHKNWFSKPNPTKVVVEEIDQITVPYEEEKMIKTHPFYVPEVHPFGKMGYSHKNWFSKPNPSKLVVEEIDQITVPYEEEKIIKTHPFYVPEAHPFGKMGYSHKNWFSKPNPSKLVVEEFDQISVPYEEEKIIKTHPVYYPQHLKTVVEEPLAYFDSIKIPYEKEGIFKTHSPSFYHSQSLPTVVEESLLVTSKGSPFTKYYPSKARFENIGSTFF